MILSMFKESEIKDKASNYGEGVKYISGEKVVIDGYEGFKALYSFKDINKVKINPSPEDKMPFGDEFKNEEEKPVDDNLKFNFAKGNPSTLVIDFPKPELDDEVDLDSSKYRRLKTQHLMKMHNKKLLRCLME